MTEPAAANAHEQGQYLWPQASKLPSPIPLRARVRGLEDCSPCVRHREENTRQLFDVCRTAGMILEQNDSGNVSYWLVTDWTENDQVYGAQSRGKCVKLCEIAVPMDSEHRWTLAKECFVSLPRAMSLARSVRDENESREGC